MQRSHFVFEEEGEAAQAPRNPHSPPHPEMELQHEESQESQSNHADPPPNQNKQQHNPYHVAVNAPHHQQQETHKKRQPRRRQKANINSDSENEENNPQHKEKPQKHHELVAEEPPRQRKKSTTYEEKVDLYHKAEASQMKPNLFQAEEVVSPTHVRNDRLAFKPHHISNEEYHSHDQHIRTQQLKHNEHHESKNHKQKEEELRESYDIGYVDRKKIKKLPSINEDQVGNSLQRSKNFQQNIPAAHDASTIILKSTEIQPVMQTASLKLPVDSFHHLQQEEDSAIKAILEPVHSRLVLSFTRDSSCGNYIHPDYALALSDGTHIISSKKQSCYFNSYYSLIATNSYGGKDNIGFLRGNFGGTQFNLYQSHEGVSSLAATIVYQVDCSCCGPRYRVMEVYVRGLNSADLMFQRETKRKNLKELFEEGYDKDIAKLVTQAPIWNERSQVFTMNLGGKAKMPSTKNMALLSPDKSQALLFCKTDQNSFHLQINRPLNILVAMGILMSSFDFKLFCQ